MIHHLSIGVRNLGRARDFYDATLGELGFRRVFEDDTAIGYGLMQDEDILCLKLNSHAVPMGPGGHLAFAAPTRAAVERFHASAVRHGGRCNGQAALREDYGPSYYAAFVYDPEGNRIEAVCKTGHEDR